MMKIYLDWNIITHMKQGKHDGLANLITQNPDFLISYSTAHISDLLMSHTGSAEHTKWINEDLSFISKLTNNWCTYIEGKDVVTKQLDPNVLFEDRLTELDHFNSYDLIDIMLKNAEDVPEAYDLILKLKESPLPEIISDGLQNPITTDHIRKLYPGLYENPTMGNLINIGWQNYRKMMETDEYKDMREALQNHLDLKPNGLIDKNPFQEMDKIYEKGNQQINDLIKDKNDNSPKWFQDITNNYLLLDMHGFHEDKIKVTKSQKGTMRNTIDDGFHAAFASTCEYYITNDVKSIRKTKEVYNKLNIDTKVFSSDEFVTYYSNYISTQNNSAMIKVETEHFKNFIDVINQIKSLSDDPNKVTAIIGYIEESNSLLLEYGIVLNSLLTNQERMLEALTATTDSISNLHDRINITEKLLDIRDKHIDAHDSHLDALGKHLESHDNHLSTHDQYLEFLSQRMDLLDT